MRLISDMNVNDKNLSRTRMLMSVFRLVVSIMRLSILLKMHDDIQMNKLN